MRAGDLNTELCSRCGKTVFGSKGLARQHARVQTARGFRLFVYFDAMCRAWHCSSRQNLKHAKRR